MSRGSGRVCRECWRTLYRRIFMAERIEYGSGGHFGPVRVTVWRVWMEVLDGRMFMAKGWATGAFAGSCLSKLAR